MFNHKRKIKTIDYFVVAHPEGDSIKKEFGRARTISEFRDIIELRKLDFYSLSEVNDFKFFKNLVDGIIGINSMKLEYPLAGGPVL